MSESTYAARRVTEKATQYRHALEMQEQYTADGRRNLAALKAIEAEAILFDLLRNIEELGDALDEPITLNSHGMDDAMDIAAEMDVSHE